MAPEAGGEVAPAGARPLVGRLAPSPTGTLHAGHARSFLLAWWSARSRGGRVVLRIEDLDRARCKEELVDQCLRDLEWLGLDWDGEPVRQSADLGPYAAACERLVAAGRAFDCTCTRAEVAAASAPHAGGETRYPGTCRDGAADPGRPAGLRFRVQPGPVRVHDRLAGARRFDVGAEVGDFLLRRRDGTFAYQLSVVVDDAASGVTEVLRGDDLLPSAARQELLYSALGLPPPAWVHVPLVVDADGQRLAKRRGEPGLADLRRGGVDPRRVVAWAARSSGQAAGELATAGEVLAGFDLGKLPPGPVTAPEGRWAG